MQSISIVFPEALHVAVREISVDPPKPTEIQCKAEVSLISIGTETRCLKGKFDQDTNWAGWVQWPFKPGYSMSATVTAVGPRVEGIRVGDRVAVSAPHQQIFNVDYKSACVIPEQISAEEACWKLLAVTTQLGIRNAHLSLGESVGVIGLGMLGQLVAQYAKVFGARRVVAIDPIESRLEIAKGLGSVTHTIASDAKAAFDEVQHITNGKMLDAVFDVTGISVVLSQATPLVRKFGRVVLVGDTTTPSQQYLGPNVVSDSLSIIGSHGSNSPENNTVYAPWSNKEMSSLFFDYLLQGRMNVKELITHRRSPLDALSVYESLLQGAPGAIGVVFDWNQV